MTFLEGIILGAVQGLTEFLPISSSGHLVLAESLLGTESAVEGGAGVFLEVAVHTATLLAVLIFFRRRILEILSSLPALFRLGRATDHEKEMIKLAGLLVIGTIPAGLAGILLQDAIEGAFKDPRLVLAMLCVTGCLLLATRFAPKGGASVGLGRTIAIGVAQAAALTPGISRSGSTISCAMFLKVEGEKAAEFSFLLSIPAIAGAAVLQVAKGPAVVDVLPVAAACTTAFATGYGAMILLFGVLRKRALWVFGIYCLALGAGGIALLALR